MPDKLTLTINGKQHTVQAAPDTPLLYVLRNELELNGPQFGCGVEQCGSCMVLLGNRAAPSCKIPISELQDTPITTLEGLAPNGQRHPIQQAFIDCQAAQCGFCINGMMIRTAGLLAETPAPADEQIRGALDGNLCRCGAHLRILRAVKRAIILMRAEVV